jgi:hypothetical protein
MPVQQHFDPIQRKPRHSKEEFIRRGNEIYKSQIRPTVETENHSKIVAINIETGAFEVADDVVSASHLFLAQYPDTQTWFVHIGHRAVT